MTALRRSGRKPERLVKLRPKVLRAADELGRLRKSRSKAERRIRALEETLLDALGKNERALLSDGSVLIAAEIERDGYRVGPTTFVQLKRIAPPEKKKKR